eukprot:TRINITY_DN5643_c0_g1_i1.p2 TRINITY_DN5643_c0_g1~~TRINITY_DN5643_c0_g1_i1.p2  ORF type:complete len:155 (-),score=4.73 TRINITY_DN5643_c0_g1_i1:203-667(-)
MKSHNPKSSQQVFKCFKFSERASDQFRNISELFQIFDWRLFQKEGFISDKKLWYLILFPAFFCNMDFMLAKIQDTRYVGKSIEFHILLKSTVQENYSRRYQVIIMFVLDKHFIQNKVSILKTFYQELGWLDEISLYIYKQGSSFFYKQRDELFY